jgi:hypothetical protein
LLGRLWRRADRRIIALIVVAKVAVLLTVCIAYHWFPFDTGNYYVNFHQPLNGTISLRTAYETWDTQHYIYLSETGYVRGSPSIRFQPLFPLAIHILTPVLRDPLVTALIIANICSAIALYYLYAFVIRLGHGVRTATLTVLLVLAFPTAFYLSLAYSESLFLLLSVCFFYYLYEDNYRLCSLFAFLLPLTRPTGILIAVPWAIHHYQRRRVGSAHAGRRPNPVYLGAPLAGYAVYLAVLFVTTGDPFSGIQAQSHVVASWSLSAIARPDLLVRDFFSPFLAPNLHLLGFTNGLLDRVFFVLFLTALAAVLLETGPVLCSYYFLLGIVPILGTFMSYTRYLMPAFPLYIAVARMAERGKLHPILVPGMLVSYALSVVLLGMHALNHWVA